MLSAQDEDGELVAEVGVLSHHLVEIVLLRHHLVNKITCGGIGVVGNTKTFCWKRRVIMPHAAASVDGVVAPSEAMKVSELLSNSAESPLTMMACLTARSASAFWTAIVC